MRNAPPSVFVETPPIVPLLGYTDCSDPAVLATEASLAHDHGIHAFIFNFYFDGTTAELELPLRAFARMQTELQFAVNLCCHMPKRKLPFRVGEDWAAPHAYWTEAQFRSFARYLRDEYLTKSHYFRPDGRGLVTFYHVNAFRYLYGPSGLARMVETLRSTCGESGFELHVVGLFSVAGGWNRYPVDAVELPFDSFSCYVALPDFDSDLPVQSFPALARKWLGVLSQRGPAPRRRPVIPCVGAGWNATARGASGYDPSAHGVRFPYFPVVVDDDPHGFEQYLFAAASQAAIDIPGTGGVTFLGPWNEWSEGCYLLPDARFGYDKLRAIERVKRRMRAAALGPGRVVRA